MTPIIDSEGMFGGDRMAKLSDQAKLYWPWFYLASNGYARLEINYRRLLTRVFSGFMNPPSEHQFVSCIKEYCDAYLLFTYRSGGQLWGQWDTSAKFLPRHKTTSDERSPIPPQEDLIRWREEYAATKTTEVAVFATFAEKVRESAEKVREISREEKRIEEKRREEKSVELDSSVLSDPTVLDTFAQTSLSEVDQAEDKASKKKKYLDETHQAYYSEYWVHRSKEASRKAWPRAIVAVTKDKKLSTPEAVAFLMERMREQKREIATGRPDLDPLSKTYPASWLNGKRWEDDVGPPPISVARIGVSSVRDEIWSNA